MNKLNRSLLISLTSALLMASCNKQSAQYQVKEEKIVPDNRTITEVNATEELLDSSKNLDITIAKIEARKIPTFSWKKFWNQMYQDRVLENMSKNQINLVFTLSEGQCKSYEINAYAQFLINEAQRVLEDKKLIFLNELNQLLTQCQITPNLDITKRAIIETLKLIEKSDQKDQYVSIIKNLIDILQNKLSKSKFQELVELIDIGFWNNASNSLSNEVSANTIYNMSRALNLLNDDSTLAIMRKLLVTVIGNDENMDKIIATYGIDESIKIMDSYGEQFFHNTSKRNLAMDVNSLAKHLMIDKTNLTQLQLTKQWKKINRLKNIINLHSTDENFASNLRAFNKVIKNFEALLLHSQDGDNFIKIYSGTDILAKWIELRLFNKKIQKHSSSLIDIRNLSLDDGRIEKVLAARVQLYVAEENKKESLKTAYCKRLDELGIKKDIVTNLNQILNNISNLSGCITYKANKIETKIITTPSFVLDDDLFLTLNNMNLKIESSQVDVNFIDLSTTIEHEHIPYLATPTEYNAIVVPLLLGIIENGTYVYFSYHYTLATAKQGPSYGEIVPKKGLKGQDLSIELKPNSDVFYPLLISKGGPGQRVTEARSGGKGVELTLDIGLLSMPQFNFSNTLDQLDAPERLYEILNTADVNTLEYKVLNYIPALEKFTDLESIKNIQKIKEQFNFATKKLNTCLQTSDPTCVMKEIAQDALQKLKIELLETNDDPQSEGLNADFTLEDASEGPTPLPGAQGENGTLL